VLHKLYDIDDKILKQKIFRYFKLLFPV